MSHKVETMAFANEVPWHGLGVPVSDDLTPAQIQKAAGLDWTVSKRDLFYKKNGSMEKVEDKFGLVRDTDERLLSVVGATWKPVQNNDALDFFQKFVEETKMTMETAGSLDDGRYIWGLARLGKDFKLGKTDEVRGFVLLCSPHVHGKALLLQTTAIRVVCWNTLTFAIGASLKGDGSGFRMPHSMTFDDNMKKSAAKVLGLATEQFVEFQEAATLLSKTKVSAPAVEDYFCEVLQFDPKEAQKKKDGEAREPLMLPKFRAALEHSPGHNLSAGTMWSALNAVTFVVDHQTGRDRGTALKNAWLGHTAGIKRRALELAVKIAA